MNIKSSLSISTGPGLTVGSHTAPCSETPVYDDYIALRLFATSVNALVKSHGIGPLELQVTLDGTPLSPEEAGANVVVTENRRFFRVEEGRMYEVVALSEFSDHELQMNLKSARLALFAMTSGADA